MTTIQVKALELCGKAEQGELILIKDTSAQKINLISSLQNKNYTFNHDGVTLIALHRDLPSLISLETLSDDQIKTHYLLKIIPHKWDIQKISGIAQNKVTPGKQDMTAIQREQQDVNHALNHFRQSADWQQGFILPVDGIISGHFGNQRIFNGLAKNPHNGTDIAVKEGTPVKASGNGKVILSEKDYFYTGNLVIIDHGYGLQTIYAHLKATNVKTGDMVKKGDIIGTVGQTGRAKGAHLHWGASLNNIRFNPYSLLDIQDKKCRNLLPEGKN